MSFFDEMKESLVSAGKDVSQKAKEVSGVAKLKLDVQRGLCRKTVCRTGTYLF